jgi:hypothetical protein
MGIFTHEFMHGVAGLVDLYDQDIDEDQNVWEIIICRNWDAPRGRLRLHCGTV